MFDWFINLNSTDKIALLAFVVALYSAVLSTILYRKEHLNLKLEYLKKNYLTFSRTNSSLNNYGEKHQIYKADQYTIALYVRLINKSKSPTTIYNFKLNNKYVFDSFTNVENSLIPKSFKYYNDILVSDSSMSIEKDFSEIKPLLKLEPLAITEGCLIFTNIDTIPKKFKIKVCATQRNKTFTLKFNITNDFRVLQE